MLPTTPPYSLGRDDDFAIASARISGCVVGLKHVKTATSCDIAGAQSAFLQTRAAKKDFPASYEDTAPKSALTETVRFDINPYGDVDLGKNDNALMHCRAGTAFDEPSILQTKVMKPDQVWMAFR
jgi:hypothetical protein